MYKRKLTNKKNRLIKGELLAAIKIYCKHKNISYTEFIENACSKALEGALMEMSKNELVEIIQAEQNQYYKRLYENLEPKGYEG